LAKADTIAAVTIYGVKRACRKTPLTKRDKPANAPACKTKQTAKYKVVFTIALVSSTNFSLKAMLSYIAGWADPIKGVLTGLAIP
jgi:hypothetical protein